MALPPPPFPPPSSTVQTQPQTTTWCCHVKLRPIGCNQAMWKAGSPRYLHLSPELVRSALMSSTFHSLPLVTHWQCHFSTSPDWLPGGRGGNAWTSSISCNQTKLAFIRWTCSVSCMCLISGSHGTVLYLTPIGYASQWSIVLLKVRVVHTVMSCLWSSTGKPTRLALDSRCLLVRVRSMAKLLSCSQSSDQLIPDVHSQPGVNFTPVLLLPQGDFIFTSICYCIFMLVNRVTQKNDRWILIRFSSKVYLHPSYSW